MTDQQKLTLISVTLGMICFLLMIATAIVLVMDANGAINVIISGQTTPVEAQAQINEQPVDLEPTMTPESAQQEAEPTNTLELTATSQLSATFTPEPTAIPNADGQIASIIGYSVEGCPIEVYRFGSGPSHRLIFAGIHGGYEYNTVDLAHELILYLQGHLNLVPEDISLFIVPVLNIDGFVNGRGEYAGRANANGVDLNRNWDLNWSHDWDKSGCWNYVPIDGGLAAFSEPETKALSDFMLAENIEAVISYHSAALGIFYGGQPDPHLPSVSLAEAVSAVSPYTYPGISYGCSSTGMSAHWAAAQDIAAVDIELTNHSDTDFDVNLRILIAFLNWKR